MVGLVENRVVCIFYTDDHREHGNWYRGTADALAQNIDFLKRSHEPYVIVAGGDCVYKLDYNKVLDYHIQKKADITIVCKDVPATEDVSRFGVVQMNEESRIIDFEEKPMVAQSHTISTGIYVLRRRQLIEMLEKSMEEHRFDFVTDILIRYKNLKQIYGYKLENYWSNIASVESYYQTNMDFLKPRSANISSIRSRISTPRWMILLRQNTMWEQKSATA